MAVHFLRLGEGSSQREQTVHHIAFLEGAQIARSFSYGSDEEPQRVVIIVLEVDGDRTAQQRASSLIGTKIDKLAGQGVWQRFVAGQLQKHMMGRELLTVGNSKIQTVFFHVVGIYTAKVVIICRSWYYCFRNFSNSFFDCSSIREEESDLM